MPVEIHPKSFEEVEKALLNQLVSHTGKAGAQEIKVSRSPGRKLLVIKTTHAIKVGMADDAVELRRGARKIVMLLDAFRVSTSVSRDGTTLELLNKPGWGRGVTSTSLEALRNAKNRIFVERAAKAVARLDRELSMERLDEASAASDDYSVLASALANADLPATYAEDDPLAEAKLRGLKAKSELLKLAGGALSGEQAAEQLGIKRQSVDKRRSQNKLIGLTQGRRGYAYPAFQFEETVSSHLEEILQALKDSDPWTQLGFFVNSNGMLDDRTPLEELRARHHEAVLKAVRHYQEQGTA